MGRGDKKTKRGKIALGTFGVSRPRKTQKASVAVAEASTTTKKTSTKKARAKKAE